MRVGSKSYHRIASELGKLENEHESKLEEIRNIKEEAKKMKKGSQERKDKMAEAEKIKQSNEFKELEIKLNTMRWCFNVAYYL